MQAFFFIFSMALMLMCMLAASVSLCAYLVTRRSVFVAWVCAFAAYLFESGLVLFEEYMPRQVAVELLESPGAVENIGVKLVLSAVAVFSFWFFLGKVYDLKGIVRRFAVPIAVVAAQVLSAVIPLGFDTGNASFYLVRDAFFLLCAIGLLAASWKARSVRLRGVLAGARGLVVACVVFEVAALLLDATSLDPLYAAFWSKVLDPSQAMLYFYIVRRNVFEIGFVLLCGVMAIRYGGRLLSLRFSSAQPVKEEGSASNEIRLDRFSSRHGLSEREREVLTHILDGASYQQIASELFISLGTVKAHANHIYGKTGASGRQDLIKMFWSE